MKAIILNEKDLDYDDIINIQREVEEFWSKPDGEFVKKLNPIQRFFRYLRYRRYVHQIIHHMFTKEQMDLLK